MRLPLDDPSNKAYAKTWQKGQANATPRFGDTGVPVRRVKRDTPSRRRLSPAGLRHSPHCVKGTSMTRVRLVGIALAAAATLTATACTSSSDPADTTTSAGQTTQAVDPGELTVWVMGDSSANFEELIAPFVSDTGTKVDVVAVPWDSIDQKLTTAVASGDGPDLMQIGVSKLRNTADSGALLALDDAVIADYPGLDPSNYVGDPITIGGSTMAVPWVSDTRVLFYRTDILAENGIDSPPSTWDELRADAKVLSARGDNQYGYYIPQWDSALPMIMTWDFGGDAVNSDGMIDFDTDAFHSAADLYTGLYEDGSVPTNGDFDQTQGFVSGIAPMLISGPYLAASISGAAPSSTASGASLPCRRPRPTPRCSQGRAWACGRPPTTRRARCRCSSSCRCPRPR